MTKPTEDEKAAAGQALSGMIGSIVLAFGVSTLAYMIAIALGASEFVAGLIDTTLMFGILIINPVEAYCAKVSRADWIRKGAIGLGGGLIVAWFFATDVIAPAPSPENGGADDDPNGLPLGFFAIFLLLPLFFLFPILERFLKGRPNAELPASEDLQISIVFPIYMTLMMTLHLVVVGSLWLLDVSLPIALLLLLGVVLFAVAEVWTADDGELMNLEDDRWRPRAESAAQAWEGLRRAIRPTVTSSLFLGSTLYLCIKAAIPFMDSGLASDDIVGTEILTSLFISMGIVLVGFVVLLGLATLTIAGAMVVIARQKGTDPLTLGELAAQANARLLMGGIQHVRPDQETD